MSETAPAPRRWSFWLIASLCLNFFLIGLVVMGLIVARNRTIAAAVTGGTGAFSPAAIVQMLPRSGALKMCEVVAAKTPAFRDLGRALIDARRAMFKTFRAEPFDEGAFRAALARVTEADVAITRAREASVAEIVAKLTPEERKHFTRQVVQRFLSVKRPRALRNEAGALAAVCRELGAPGAADLPQ
jgi:uncharacterized membrane protein